MANKNPFLKTGKRKRKKAKKNVETKPDQKPFCPRLMIRYDQPDNSTIGYKTVWVCRMCMKCVLHEGAVQSHLQKCKVEFKNKTTVYEPVILNESLDNSYICQICNNVFSRKVALKKHMEKHENTPDTELYGSESSLVIKFVEIDLAKPNATRSTRETVITDLAFAK
ncbi:Zinc finger C2H2-type [Cinara cedri]|uniref:Zinc finger C2H2-type n=1 Tax=Cinara cedri TaxID=506608 RepID=A0A5E4MJH4_9HEMI|nr:Zinc finger C2H2-type [Cinara cedri]